MTNQKTKNNWLIRFLASPKFFIGVLIFFVLQAGWIACTAMYPMAFDEDFHFGIIQIYAQQWSPILTHQPANPGVYGQLIHDPSYLFHYLMSFPYRLLDGLFHNTTLDVVGLRFIDVALFTVGLWLFRKLLLKFGLSKALSNVVILLTTLIPIAPFLAGQINYDNLVMPLVALTLLITLKIKEKINSESKMPFVYVASLAIVGMLASLVKYTYLPFIAGAVIYLIIVWLRHKKRADIGRSLGITFLKLGLWVKIGLVVALLISLGLFGQRYFYNLAEFHTLSPDCDDVLSVDECMNYGPYQRDQHYVQAKISPTDPAPIQFFGTWMGSMVYRLYFTINSGSAPSRYQNYIGLPLVNITAVVACGIGLIGLIIFGRRIFRTHPTLWLLVLSGGLYIVSLYIVDYLSYLHTGRPVAINGRYLLVMMPLLIGIVGLGWRELLNLFKNASLIKTILVVIVVLLSLNGGGAISFLYFADPNTWYFANDPLTGFNAWLRGIISPLIVKWQWYEKLFL